MTDQWSSEETVDLNSDTIQKYKEQVAQNIALPPDAQEWVNALRGRNVAKVKKLLKNQRATLPKKYKKLYRESDLTILKAIHTMRLQSPFFTDQEKRESQKFLEFEAVREQGTNHPLMNKKLF
jgi:uncharacterized protein YbgA (DUF1722 family)